MARDRIERILLAVDGSPESTEAASYVAQVAAGLRARVTLIHVAPDASLPLGTAQLGGAGPDPGPEDEVDMVKTIWEGAQAILDRSRTPLGRLGVKVDGLLRNGNPAEEIVRLAREESFDLVAVGGGRTDEDGKDSLGDTAACVVRDAPCPVLVVKP